MNQSPNLELDLKRRSIRGFAAIFTVVLGLHSWISSVQAANDCNYGALPGKEFTFAERAESLQRYGYQGWYEEANVGKSLSYKDYAGKKGKLQEQLIKQRVFTFYMGVLETCEKVYVHIVTRTPTIADAESVSGNIYFTDTLRLAESMIGKTVWVNQTRVLKEQTLFTDDPNVSYQLAHLEPIEITAVHLKTLGHGRGAGPFDVVVKKQNGETGYLRFSDRYIFAKYPIDPTWDKEIVELIRQRKIRIGMTEQQALLSWGPPRTVNKTVGAFGVREQWVYGEGQFLYMEDGKLTSFQTSSAGTR